MSLDRHCCLLCRPPNAGDRLGGQSWAASSHETIKTGQTKLMTVPSDKTLFLACELEAACCSTSVCPCRSSVWLRDCAFSRLLSRLTSSRIQKRVLSLLLLAAAPAVLVVFKKDLLLAPDSAVAMFELEAAGSLLLRTLAGPMSSGSDNKACGTRIWLPFQLTCVPPVNSSRYAASLSTLRRAVLG